MCNRQIRLGLRRWLVRFRTPQNHDYGFTIRALSEADAVFLAMPLRYGRYDYYVSSGQVG